MSSRALRKAQRLREEQEQAAKSQEAGSKDDVTDEESDEEETHPAPPAKQSLFAMLNETNGDESENDDDAGEATQVGADIESQTEETLSEVVDSRRSMTRSKKKKKGKKAKGAKNDQNETTATRSNIDEIELALRELKASDEGRKVELPPEQLMDPTTQEICHLLSIDSLNLHASNEMRRLFGRAAVETRTEEERGARARRGRARGGGLAPGGPHGRGGLSQLAQRRNIFMQGKDDWPPATGSGLGMEIVEKRGDGSVEYRFVHQRAYQDVQRQFEACVASMDPERMIQMMHFNRQSH